ncbi:MAG TPA: hypothetical protein VNW26_03430 [Steroidobacteraceae bacterium]|jgi:uncharacterized lipoprotein|nr:hypothetical protein [Steroidobacteraceae bacterium]
MSLDRVLTLIAAAALVSGCHLFGKFTADCHRPQEYQRAGQVAPLKVPAGLDAPNTQGAMAIPAVALAPPPPGPKDTCLDVPPRYVPAPPNKAASETPAVVPPPLPTPPAPDSSSSAPP